MTMIDTDSLSSKQLLHFTNSTAAAEVAAGSPFEVNLPIAESTLAEIDSCANSLARPASVSTALQQSSRVSSSLSLFYTTSFFSPFYRFSLFIVLVDI